MSLQKPSLPEISDIDGTSSRFGALLSQLDLLRRIEPIETIVVKFPAISGSNSQFMIEVNYQNPRIPFGGCKRFYKSDLDSCIDELNQWCKDTFGKEWADVKVKP